MPPEFFKDTPYDYNVSEILRVQEIIENVIKTSDSRETVLAKKRQIRQIADHYQKERTFKIKNVKIINLPPGFSPMKRHVEMAFDLGEFFDTTLDPKTMKLRK